MSDPARFSLRSGAGARGCWSQSRLSRQHLNQITPGVRSARPATSMGPPAGPGLGTRLRVRRPSTAGANHSSYFTPAASRNSRYGSLPPSMSLKAGATGGLVKSHLGSAENEQSDAGGADPPNGRSPRPRAEPHPAPHRHFDRQTDVGAPQSESTGHDDGSKDQTLGEMLCDALNALQSLPPRLERERHDFEESIASKSAEIAALVAANLALDTDMANANLSLDEFERQEADARRQHADLEADMTAVEAELAALKAKAESLERAAEDTESQHELDLANCRQEIDGTRESYQSQANLAVAKSKELDELRAELSYVQRTIEKQVLTVRELEEDKAALESQLREVTAGKAQLSTTATRLQQKTGDLTQTLDRERLAATEWQANLKEATDRAVQLLKTSQEKASAAQSHLNELLTVSDTLKLRAEAAGWKERFQSVAAQRRILVTLRESVHARVERHKHAFDALDNCLRSAVGATQAAVKLRGLGHEQVAKLFAELSGAKVARDRAEATASGLQQALLRAERESRASLLEATRAQDKALGAERAECSRLLLEKERAHAAFLGDLAAKHQEQQSQEMERSRRWRADLQDSVAALEAEHEGRVRSTAEALEAQLHAARGELDDATAAAETGKAELDALQTAFAQFKEDCVIGAADRDAERAKLVDALESQREAAALAKRELLSAVERETSAERRFAEAVCELDARNSECVELRKTGTDLRARLGAASAKVLLAETQCTRLRKSADEVQRDHDAVVQRLAEVDSACAQLRKARDVDSTRRLDVTDASAEVASLRDNNETLRAELIRSKALIAETGANLRESAQLTMNALSGKQQMAAVVERLAMELAAERKKLIDLRDSGEGAADVAAGSAAAAATPTQAQDAVPHISPVLAEGHAPTAANGSPSGRPKPQADVRHAEGGTVHKQGAGTAVTAAGGGRNVAGLAADSGGAKSAGEQEPENPCAAPCKDVEQQQQQFAGHRRRDTRKKSTPSWSSTGRPSAFPATLTPEAGTTAGVGSPATRGSLRLTRAPRKPKRAALHRPRVTPVMQDTTADVRGSSNKPRVKRSKMAAATVIAAASAIEGDEDEEDWMM